MKQGIHGSVRHNAVFGKLVVCSRCKGSVQCFLVAAFIKALLLNDTEKLHGMRQCFFLTGCRIVRRKRIYGKCLVVNMLCGILRSAVVSNGPENATVFFIEAVLCHKIISTLRIP